MTEENYLYRTSQTMLRQIDPERIICYNTPFPEMEGNIVFVDYELSSWRYMERQSKAHADDDLECYKIGGANIKNYDTIDGYMIEMGMGSAYGAQWKPNPNKPQDMAFIGPPNTIQRIYIPNRKGGYWIQAKYGSDGWAVAFRHETEHTPNRQHSNPHDHSPMAYNPHTHAPDWDNTPEINYPGAIPEFKTAKERQAMINWEHIDGIITNLTYDEEALRFKTISEFKYCLSHGAEIVIEWDGVEYGIFKDYVTKRYYIGHDSPDTNVFYDTPDALLEYHVGSDRLRDVITKVIVIDRTL